MESNEPLILLQMIKTLFQRGNMLLLLLIIDILCVILSVNGEDEQHLKSIGSPCLESTLRNESNSPKIEIFLFIRDNLTDPRRGISLINGNMSLNIYIEKT